MTRFVIDTVADAGSGHIVAEVRRDSDGALLARSGPVYASHEDAEARILDVIGKAWPSEPVDPVYPANGS